MITAVLSGGTASATTINRGGQEGIFAGGTNIGATVSSGGGLFVLSGVASRTTLSGGLEVVFAGGQRRSLNGLSEADVRQALERLDPLSRHFPQACDGQGARGTPVGSTVLDPQSGAVRPNTVQERGGRRYPSGVRDAFSN